MTPRYEHEGYLVSAEEIIKLSDYFDFDTTRFATGIYNAFMNCDESKRLQEFTANYALAAVFEAGRLQGIREMKAKYRHKKIDHLTPGQELRLMRGERNIDEAAQAVGVTISEMLDYESDKRRPRDEVIQAMSICYSVDVKAITALWEA